MSETTPEARPRPAGGDGGEGFRKKLGPLPMWGWIAVIGGGLVAWRVWHDRKAGAAASSTGTATSIDTSSQVPQFVNQTYTTVTPPVVQPPPPVIIRTPGPRPPEQLTRTWESLGGSTYAQVAQRLLGNPDVANLHPANAAAKNWVEKVYAKNHHAIMPKGLLFTYTEGTVTPKTAAK